ncbi:39S ribosomal protein L14, mitochondrial [Trichinella spiralis]|uniref:Large ribosomal subunit protein uL14m n=1 Tax=Trichinella spiralis TaxID=6334 RepID=A0A0V1BMR9_TRISP|nr:39S ribosomal protein L14, mitochondrial [Trichinella spiralis]
MPRLNSKLIKLFEDDDDVISTTVPPQETVQEVDFFSTTSLLNWIHLKTRFRVVDNSDLGKQAMLGGKPPYCIRVYRQGRLGKKANRGQLGDKILVAIKGELRRAYIVGWKAHHSQIRHGVPRSDSNNIVLLDANENPLGNKVLVPVPAWLQSKPDLAKIVQSASKVV